MDTAYGHVYRMLDDAVVALYAHKIPFEVVVYLYVVET